MPDAGSYWYHPHQRSFEQVGRGLYGALIVEEREPVAVDRDITWMLGDWRLDREAQIVDDFGGRMEMAMAGRIGTVTVNGRLPAPLQVRAGEGVRLRLYNSANARVFALAFRNHRPLIIAMDGQPVEPHAPLLGRVLLGPAMRLDLLIDMTCEPGSRHTVRDSFYPTRAYALSEIVYSEARPLRRAPAPPISLPPNTMPEPDLNLAERHEVGFGGGMMGMMRGGMRRGGRPGTHGMMGGIWSINGVTATGHVMDPLLTLRRGQSYILALSNDTAWHHPIHLHGHSFRVIARNGQPTRFREWQDTVFMAARERVDIAFVADNPGDWMFHCHILEHLEGGMMGVIRVA